MGNRIYQIANDSKSLGEQVASEKRTHYCGSLRAENAEQKVVLKGWVETRRDHGNLIFLDIRDSEGFVQFVVNQN
jgi:aspartyl-tRNA synthetase